MVNSLDTGKRIELVKFGFPETRSRDYGLMLQGFDDHRIMLDKHTDNPAQLPRMPFRIGNPAQIDNGEADLLLRKMLAGYYPWPVDECFEHEFEGRNGVKVKGCKWCRERKTQFGLSGDVAGATPERVQEAVLPESPVSQTPDTPPAVTLEEVVCVNCGFMSKAVTAKGKPRSQKQMAHALKLHRKNCQAAHRTGVPV